MISKVSHLEDNTEADLKLLIMGWLKAYWDSSKEIAVVEAAFQGQE